MEIDQKRNLEDYLSQDLMDSHCRVACKSLDGRDLPAEKETEPEGVWKLKDYVDFAVREGIDSWIWLSVLTVARVWWSI